MSNDPMNRQKSEEASIDPIQDEHFPGLFQSADKASLVAQRSYLWFQGIHLLSLILGSVAMALMPLATNTVKWPYIVQAIILMLGIILFWVSRGRKYDEKWFRCRAIAESAKSITWRFMMQAEPFTDDSTATCLFIAKLKEIREPISFSSTDLALNLDPYATSISDFMTGVRDRPINKRKAFYLKSRLRDQKAWYSNKATFNVKWKERWFWITLVLQALAVVFAIIQVFPNGLPVYLAPLLVTWAAAAVAWNQMKRHGELAQTYTLAAQELGDQEAIATDLTGKDFLKFVKQVEETISREHTMWRVRRNV